MAAIDQRMTRQFYGVKDIAVLLGANEVFVRRLFASGQLGGFKLGRAWLVDIASFNAQIAQLRQRAARLARTA